MSAHARPQAVAVGPPSSSTTRAATALAECVESLLADTSAGGPPDVVVVDNGSRDGSIATLRAGARTSRVVDPRRATSATPAARTAASPRRSTPVVAVCNPDLRRRARVRPRRCSPASTRRPPSARSGPRIREPGRLDLPVGARRYPTPVDAVGHGLARACSGPTNPFTRRYRQLDADPATPRDVDWVSGAAIWLRRDALDAVGGWDDGYFMYVEDVDLCWRLGGAGWRVAYEPGGEVVARPGC